MSGEITGAKQRGRPFLPGHSGNPKGKPKGARNRATLAAEALLDGEAEALTRKAIELALAGDTVALRLCLERLLPPRKDRPVALALDDSAMGDNAARAANAVLASLAAGQITVSEANAAMELIGSCRRVAGLDKQASPIGPITRIEFICPDHHGTD